MERRVLVGVAATALLAGTLVGALYLESNDPPPVVAFPVTWTTSHGPATSHTGTLQEGENETVPMQLTAENVTEVEVRLVWEDDVGERDRFRLAVTPPGGAERTNTSRNGTIVLRFPLGQAPDSKAINATNRSQAADQAARRFTSNQGVGNWTIRVTLAEAPGVRPVPEAPQVETESDGQNDFQLRFSFESYRARLAATPDGG